MEVVVLDVVEGEALAIDRHADRCRVVVQVHPRLGSPAGADHPGSEAESDRGHGDAAAQLTVEGDAVLAGARVGDVGDAAVLAEDAGRADVREEPRRDRLRVELLVGDRAVLDFAAVDRTGSEVVEADRVSLQRVGPNRAVLEVLGADDAVLDLLAVYRVVLELPVADAVRRDLQRRPGDPAQGDEDGEGCHHVRVGQPFAEPSEHDSRPPGRASGQS